MVTRIVVELETPGDSRTMFRVLIDGKLIAEGLTAVQAHIVVGEALNRITVPEGADILIAYMNEHDDALEVQAVPPVKFWIAPLMVA